VFGAELCLLGVTGGEALLFLDWSLFPASGVLDVLECQVPHEEEDEKYGIC